MQVHEPWVERILRVFDHIHEHLAEELEPIELAKISQFSLHHFHRVFRGMSGESVMAYVRRMRLERAALRLKFGEQPIIEVAHRSGYKSHEAFTRAFRTRFAAAPQDYREKNRPAANELSSYFQRYQTEATLLAVRHVGPYEDCMTAWDRLREWTKQVGVWKHRQHLLGLCYDDPDVTLHSHLRYDACIAIPPGLMEQYQLPSDISIRRLPPGNYAGAMHIGGYDTIFDTYIALLGDWLPKRSAELVDEPVVEFYLTFPDEVEAADLRTEVCVRLAQPLTP